MFVIPTTQVGFTYRAVAMLVAFAVVFATLGWRASAEAANLTYVSNTLTDSAPSVLSGHFISFMIPTSSSALGSGDTITVTFPSGFTGVGSLLSTDLTVRVNGGAPETIGGYSTTSLSFSFNGVTAATTSVITIQTVSTKVTNPSTGSYEFTISTPVDTGQTRVAIVDTVEVTAAVDTTFDFVVTGLGTTTSINGTTTTGSTSPTAIDFGTLQIGVIETLAQRLSVTTNARNGFVVTVEQDGNLQSLTGADIDSFSDGTATNTPAAWQPPANVLLNEDTYGHWGLTSNDSDLNSNEFNVGLGGDRWVAASTTPRAIFSHNGPSDGSTQDYGRADVGYQIQISPLQEAADDYSTTLTYIATPTF